MSSDSHLFLENFHSTRPGPLFSSFEVQRGAGWVPELNAKFFLSSGGYEEAINSPTFKDFCFQLKPHSYKGLEMKTLVVDKTGHLSVSSYANVRGLQFIFSKPEIKIDYLRLDLYPVIMKK